VIRGIGVIEEKKRMLMLDFQNDEKERMGRMGRNDERTQGSAPTVL